MKFSKGQIIIEYVLILFVVVVIATSLIQSFVSRDSENLGFIIDVWQHILKSIGSDYPDAL